MTQPDQPDRGTQGEPVPLDVALGADLLVRNPMDRFIDGIELIAAFFVGLVAADTFVIVILRYFFSYSIPDSYDFGRLLLGILIFWGIAATSYRGTHITVDLRLRQCRAEAAARDGHIRHARAAVRRGGADLHAVRQSGEYVQR